MPKKEEEIDLEEEWKKLRGKLEEEPSGERNLEEDVQEEVQEISSEQFSEFLQGGEFRPVLERDGAPGQQLEQGIEDVSVAREEKTEDQKEEFSYNVPSYEEVREQSRKIAEIGMSVKRPEPLFQPRVRMQAASIREHDFQFNPELQKIRRAASESIEESYLVKTSRREEERPRLPFEQDDTKYKGKSIR